MSESFEIAISHNGLPKEFRVTLGELVKTLLAQAIGVFGITQGTHLLGLFTSDNRELADGDTIQAAHVHPKEKLNLRPSAVRGG